MIKSQKSSLVMDLNHVKSKFNYSDKYIHTLNSHTHMYLLFYKQKILHVKNCSSQSKHYNE